MAFQVEPELDAMMEMYRGAGQAWANIWRRSSRGRRGKGWKVWLAIYLACWGSAWVGRRLCVKLGQRALVYVVLMSAQDVHAIRD